MNQLNTKNDWINISFGELFDIKKGVGLSKDKLSIQGKFGCILYGELYTKYHEVIQNVISRTDSDEGTSSRKGDLLIPASTTTTGIDLARASSLNEGDVLLGGDINILRKKPNAPEYNSDYIAYYLTNLKKYEIAKVAQGTTIVHLYAKDLKDIMLILPPIEIQKEIVKIVESVNKESKTTQDNIDKSEILKKSLMQKLFTQGIGHTKFKQTEIGEIPERWEIKKLSELVVFNTGRLNSNAAVFDGRYPFFTCAQETFSIDSYSFDQKAILLAGNNAAGVYSVKYYEGKFDAYQRTYVISIKDVKIFDYKYFKYFLTLKLDELKAASVGTNTKFLTVGLLRNFKVPIPDLREQKKIAEVMESIDNQIEVNQKLKAKQEQLKSGLMQDLLTGKVKI